MKITRLKFRVAVFLSTFSVTIFSLVLILGNSNASAVVPYINDRVNLQANGSEMTTTGGISASENAQISQDGRYVAYLTKSNQPVAGDTNGKKDVIVRDRKLGTNSIASLSSTGSQTTSDVYSFALSADGRYVAFVSPDTNLTAGDTDAYRDLYVRDLKNNTTELVSKTDTGGNPNNHVGGGFSMTPDISADGRFIVYTSDATNIVANDTNSGSDVFVYDRALNTTKLLSKAVSTGYTANGSSSGPRISCDGAYITFISGATDLTSATDTNAKEDVFISDRLDSNNIKNITLGANATLFGEPDIACNGSRVIYASDASNLVSGDTNSARDVFAYSIFDNLTERVNLDSSGNQSNTGSTVTNPTSGAIDFSGRYVVFSSEATNLTSGDTNSLPDIFLRDIEDGTTQMITRRSGGSQVTNTSWLPAISLNGRDVIYGSLDTGLVSGDTNLKEDIFVSQTGI